MNRIGNMAATLWMMIGFGLCWAQDPRHELEFAEEMLLGAGIRGDVRGVELARSRLEPLSKLPETSARAHYLLGFAQWQILYNNFGRDLDVEPIGRKGLDHVNAALEQDPNMADAYVVGVQLLTRMGQSNPSNAEIWQEMASFYRRGVKAAPDHPGLLVQKGLNRFYGSQDREGGLAVMREALARYQKDAADGDLHQRWWHALTCAWMGWQTLMMDPPLVDESKAVLERALALRPDFHWAREALAQSTESLTFCSASMVDGLAWRTLAEDRQGDGQDPGVADGKALAYAVDDDGGMVWFKFALHGAPNTAGFGVNLAMDVDGDPSNGAKWWGGSSKFRFDALATAWVARSRTGAYTGTVGLATADDALRGKFTTLARNNLAVTVDEDAKAIVIGVPRKDLPGKGRIKLLGAVGSNAAWNDNLPDEGGVDIELPPAR